jgi:hypothetical protein
MVLLKQGFIVEARTLIRCCFENLFWIGGLQATGAEFVKLIKEDEAASRARRGKWLLDWNERKEKRGQPFDAIKLQNYILDLQEAFPKPKLISPSIVAGSSLVRDAYIFYSQLSSDAAHPSAASLGRYISHNEGALTLHADPKMRPEEAAETREFACNALLGVSVGANEICGGTTAGKELSALFDEYRILSNAGEGRPCQ